MATAKVSTKGWIVIPAELRRKYKITPGDEVTLVDYGGVVAIVPRLLHPVQDARGTLKGGKSLTKALRRERTRDGSREDKRQRG
jgi:AbrB family looped-hinge helix DNA binding protein